MHQMPYVILLFPQCLIGEMSLHTSWLDCSTEVIVPMPSWTINNVVLGLIGNAECVQNDETEQSNAHWFIFMHPA